MNNPKEPEPSCAGWIMDKEFKKRLIATVEAWPDFMRQGIAPKYDDDTSKYIKALEEPQS